MKQIGRVLVILILTAFLMLIRFFENELFYDPLLTFFRYNHSLIPLPEFNGTLLLLHVGFRFWLNTAISLAILWFVFFEFELIRFSAIIYALFFTVLIIIYSFLIQSSEVGPHMPLDYVRRFLIQPLLLLILLPAFYFQKRK